MAAEVVADLRFALNHMTAPQLRLADFFALARRLGIAGVEIRNDIAGNAILDGTEAGAVKAAAEAASLSILTINALQRFNDWDATRAAEATALADFTKACGAAAIILVPVNDGTEGSGGERQQNVRKALTGLKPILAERGIRGLVEPLGFAGCSLRRKSEAAEAIDAVGGDFQLVHDTFHHHLAGETAIFPALTGLAHISGVSAPVAESALRDAHRRLVDAGDRIGNVEQIRMMRAAGYRGVFSFEPFAAELRTLADPARAIGESMDFIRMQLASLAA